MLVHGAEIALQAVPRLGLMLAVGDGGGGGKDCEWKRDCGGEQPMQRPFGAPVLARGRWRQNVSQETLHLSGVPPLRCPQTMGNRGQTQSVQLCAQVPPSRLLPLTTRP